MTASPFTSECLPTQSLDTERAGGGERDTKPSRTSRCSPRTRSVKSLCFSRFCPPAVPSLAAVVLPLSSECGTHTTVKDRFWPLLVVKTGNPFEVAPKRTVQKRRSRNCWVASIDYSTRPIAPMPSQWLHRVPSPQRKRVAMAGHLLAFFESVR